MPVPRHTVAIPHVQLAAKTGLNGVTELRVHGVSGTPPDAVLGDLAPEQVMGDATAGFWRSSDHRADPGDLAAGQDVDRHVEVFSWGGLTSGSKVRVLWLALLPFLLANLAGWMCPPGTRASRGRFRLHRLAHGLCALALTVNATLIALLISADICGYQTARAGIAHHQWWLAPLGWPFIRQHPARQVTAGVLVVVLFVLALVWLASRTWRYEAVPPPYRVGGGQPAESRRAAADTLPGGLADQDFWNGESTVRLLSWLHVAAAGGFAAIVLGVTTRALAGRSPNAAALGWTGVVLGAVTVGLAVAYLVLDAAATPDVAGAGRSRPTLADRAGPRIVYLLVPAGIGLLCSGWCAWLQPGQLPVRSAGLPGMAAVTGWTALAIAVAVALALVSMLLGLKGSAGTLIGGSWVTLMLAFGALNLLLLGAGIWVAHLVGPVTPDAAGALSARPGQIYLPRLVSSGMPLLFWALLLAIVAFAGAEMARCLTTVRLAQAAEYEADTASFRAGLAPSLRDWYFSGLSPFSPEGDQARSPQASRTWQRRMARAQFLAAAPHDAVWLLWTIVAGQLIMALAVWRLHVDPPLVVRDAGVALAGLALPALMAYLYAAWSNLAKRRTVGVLWDVGTFWPRAYHPLSPPCYSERAVPDLQRRLWWLHDNGGQVMLTAHSQGTVLAAAALAQPACRPRDDQTALITFGSPLVKLYAWAFPAWFGPDLLGPLLPGRAARVEQWRNFYYPTDPIGGPVTGGLSPDPPVDQFYLDPEDSYYVYGQPAPAPGGHSGYWSDHRVWAEINAVAARLSRDHFGVPGVPPPPTPVPVLAGPPGLARSQPVNEPAATAPAGQPAPVSVAGTVSAGARPADAGRGSGGGGGEGRPRGRGRGGDGSRGEGQSLPMLMDRLLGGEGQSLGRIGPVTGQVLEVLSAQEYGPAYITNVFWWLFTCSDAYKVAARQLGASRKAQPVVVPHADGARSDLLLLEPRRRKRLDVMRLDADVSQRFAVSALPREHLRAMLQREGLDEWLSPGAVLESAREIAASAQFGVGIASIPRPVRTALPSPVRPSLAAALNSAQGRTVATLGSFLAESDPDSDGTCLVTTADHALGRRWRTLTVDGAGIERVSRDKLTDSCLVRVDSAVLRGRSHEGLGGPLTRPPREPSPGFFTGAASGPTETVIRSHHPCLIDPQTRLLCCVYTDSDTAEGDSGAALIDEDDKIVGFAMGRSSYDSRVQFSYWAWAQQVYTAHGLAAGRTLGVVTEHGDH